ncbi:Serpentine Receptor, class Z [Caenorhabditis elegans]|uniref:Serpentine Receptor, class Z n=1 Tax=Caenorhabditis elegans TaxID=6239 RepID=Q6A588_CAEEL|nr:Serpentine Receptor, class Z [Caenorhabditis elegans]CCD64028.1 Serpentine Receptor, class Z [Caenorhabditis elegans]|eukprot:NP_001021315.1 Serpentine Receptor, class Z [Caenorhabditis elegans]
MNDTYEGSNTTSSFVDSTSYEVKLVFVVIFGIYLIIYPFYVYAYKINRDRDKKMLLFPTVQHFYKMVKAEYILLFSIVIYHILLVAFPGGTVVLFPLFFLVYGLACALYDLIKAFHLITFLLSFQRCLVFFFPNLGKLVAVFQKQFFKYIRLFYLICFGTELIMYFYSPTIWSKSRWTTFELYSVASAIVLYIMQLLSTLFYIPILRSARRNPYVTSGHYYSLQKYIYWQTLTSLILESFTIIMCILIYLSGLSFSEIMLAIVLANIIITPLTIQVSYLGSKKWIVYPSGNLSLKNFINVVFSIKCSSTVSP